ncbi:MAG: hypothetical protein M1812_003445 [Candelaria pacifica]|nr:MAG: hypothetical protein M1812_003445 [Candelaria pacifica]
MSGHNDPRLLYSIPNIRAYHIQHGDEASLTPSGPQTLSLLMVPSSQFEGQDAIPEEDFYLHLNLPPELDLPLPATTQIYHQPPRSYLIPRWDLGPESGAFTRIEFPGIGSTPDKCSQEDVDTFETILAQCTAFLERAAPPNHMAKGANSAAPPYNPADYGPGQTSLHTGSGSGKAEGGHIVLIDEENGSIVGELSEGFNVVEDSKLRPGSKDPVEIQLHESGNQVDVRPATEDYLRMARHPAYKDSTIVGSAATASRLIVTTSGYIGNVLTSGADSFTKKTKPNPEPMTFAPTTHTRVRKINSFTVGAAGLSAKTVGQATKYAQNLGAGLTRRGERNPSGTSKGLDKHGKPIPDYKPGILNKSMMAFSTIADGVDQAGRNLLASSSGAATTVVGHRYGDEAKGVAANLAGGVKNVGLVYIDATGVSRRAVVKSVAKGMVVGRVKGGGDLIVGGGDGGVIPAEAATKIQNHQANTGNSGGNAQGSPSSYMTGAAEPYGIQGGGDNAYAKQ